MMVEAKPLQPVNADFKRFPELAARRDFHTHLASSNLCIQFSQTQLDTRKTGVLMLPLR
mgnify:CR=1 FL=1